LCQALENAAEDRRCDVLLLARGGGSLEDLKAFNDEALARAIVASPIPVVSGVGHEVDITIADLVADRRAATPTAAAELVTPDRFEWIARIRQLLGRLEQAATTRLQARSQRVDFLGARLADPSAALRTHNHRLSNLVLRLGQDRRQAVSAARLRTSELATRLQRCGPQLALQRIGSRLQRSQERLAARQRELEQQRQSRVQTLSQRLTAVGPAGTLARGYAILQRTDGTVVRAASEAPAGQKLRARLARGALDLTVDRSEGDDAG
jgi:exodeoxyribonuclease VII large subunit